MRLVTAEEMRRLDGMAIDEYGIPGMVLMENAGTAVVRAIEERFAPLAEKKAVIFCGGGNNGGDGLVVARHLLNRGCEVRLFYLNDPEIFRGDTLANYQILSNLGVEGVQVGEGNRLTVARMALWSADFAVDAVFGTGLHDDVRDLPLEIIRMMNECKTPVISCDIPSGLDSTTGQPLGEAVHADVTVSFAYCKLGLALASAREYVGELQVADIGLPMAALDSLQSQREYLDAAFVSRWLERRKREAYKGDFGHVAVFAGSPCMPGAAILATRGALKAGAGRVTAAMPKECRGPLINQVPEAMLLSAEKANGTQDLDQLARFPADAWLIGPGLGREEAVLQSVRDFLPRLTCPAVLDADALFAVCGSNLRALRTANAPIIITPHPGEMAKLVGVSVDDVQKHRVDLAANFASQTGVIVVLKGAGTIIATPEGRLFLNDTGNPGMATGGAGDVLSGMVASLLAQGLSPAVAAACAVWLHGKAGDIGAAELGVAGLMAGNIAEYVPLALKSIGR